MMRCVLPLLLVCLVLSFSGGLVQAQTTPDLRYAFVYHDEVEGTLKTFVAALDTENHWTITELPVPLAAAYGTSEPVVWSPDGRTFYGVQYETVTFPPNDWGETATGAFGRSIVTFEYPNWELTRTIEILPAAALQDPQTADTIHIQSVSPDGRYAWVVLTKRTGFSPASLIELTTGTIFAQLECPANVIGWVENRVVAISTWQVNHATGMYETDPACPKHIFTIDLATGEQTILNPSGPTGAGFTEISYVPEWEALLLSGDDLMASVGLLKLDGTGGFFIEMAYNPSLSPDGQAMVFLRRHVVGSYLIWLDMQTGVSEVLAEQVQNAWWQGETLVYEQIRLNGAVYQRTELRTDGTRTETAVEVLNHEEIALGGSSVWDLYHSGNVYVPVQTLYDEDGNVIWDSSEALPDCNPPELVVSPDREPILGRYMWLTCTPQGNSWQLQDVLVLDLETLTIVPSPEEGWRLDGISPDREWFLYVPLNAYHPDHPPKQRGLLAYHPATDTRVTLIEARDVLVGVQFPSPQTAYQWSPIVP